MDFDDTPEEAAFRAEVREFLDAHAKRRTGGSGDWTRLAGSTDPDLAAEYRRRCREWQQLVFDSGWAGIAWPAAFGGRGGTTAQQVVFNQELAAYDASAGFITAAQQLVGPTLMAHGTPDQQRHVRPLLRGDQLWCQLFSEPGAGSDLANLATRAVRDGDEWVVNGQKVWSSSAQHADFGILLARTDPQAPKHRGISFFIVDMRSPGVEVRPLVQAHGGSHFNEVFLTDVRIPAANLVGDEGDGWRVARTTLRNESSMIGGSGLGSTFLVVLATARAAGRTDDPVVRQELARVFTHERIIRFLAMRLQSMAVHGRPERLDGSLLKNLFTRSLTHRVTLAVDLLGPAGMLWAQRTPTAAPAGAAAGGGETSTGDGVNGGDGVEGAPSGSLTGGKPDGEADGFFQYELLNQFAPRIGGGTEEVHRNNIAERLLGLPRDERTDLEVPWADLQRQP